MVERVARGRLILPAVAALSAVTAAIGGPTPVAAGGSDTTLQVRVQVVERCQIRLASQGTIDEACDSGAVDLSMPAFPTSDFGLAQPVDSELSGSLTASPFGAGGGGGLFASARQLTHSGSRQIDAANARANDLAAAIAERVRYVTFTF